MRIGLANIDSKMANLALMKVSSYWKSEGANVEWFHSMFSYDLVYASKIFTFSPDNPYLPQGTVKGGTGYDVKSKLMYEIDFCQPDYSIYPGLDYSIQYFSRGCIRNCPFCIVRQKEGFIEPVEPMQLNPNGKSIEIFDNNFFANPEWEKAIKYLKEKGQPVNFHGVDVRLLDKQMARALNSLKHKKQIHISWDNPGENFVSQLKKVLRWIKPWKLMCYVLIGFNSTPEEDLYRVETLRKLKISPFVMPYDKSDNYQRRFARWVNHKAVFQTVEFKDYKG